MDNASLQGELEKIFADFTTQLNQIYTDFISKASEIRKQGDAEKIKKLEEAIRNNV